MPFDTSACYIGSPQQPQQGPCLYYFGIPTSSAAASEPSRHSTQCEKPYCPNARGELDSLYFATSLSISSSTLVPHPLSQCIPSCYLAVVRLASEANTSTIVHAGCDSGSTQAEDLTENIASNLTKMPPPASHTRSASPLILQRSVRRTVLLRAGGELALDTMARTTGRGLGWHLRLTDMSLPAIDPNSEASVHLQFAHPSHYAGPAGRTHT